MQAARDENDLIGTAGEGRGSGGGSLAGIGSKPIDNPFLANWGPLASGADQLYVPGYSNKNQGVFTKPTQNPAASLSEAPVASKQVAGQSAEPSTSGLTGHYLFGSFLSGIMTPAQYYGRNNALINPESRQ